MSARASVYVIVEPTSGVDIGAIKEIYDIIIQLVRDGAAVVLVSSSLHETLALSDRVMVIHDGTLVAEAPKEVVDIRRAAGSYAQRQAPTRRVETGGRDKSQRETTITKLTTDKVQRRTPVSNDIETLLLPDWPDSAERGRH